MKTVKIIPDLSDSDVKRFWEKINIKDKDDCWEWTSSFMGGYPSFFLKGDTHYSHRISLFLKTGEQCEVAMHSCDNKACCNPNHLSWGTHMSNYHDMRNKGRENKASGENNGWSKLTENEVKEIRKLYSLGGHSQRKLAQEYGVSQYAIHCVVNRKYWKDV